MFQWYAVETKLISRYNSDNNNYTTGYLKAENQKVPHHVHYLLPSEKFQLQSVLHSLKNRLNESESKFQTVKVQFQQQHDAANSEAIYICADK